MKKEFYCYVCGHKLVKKYNLVSLNKNTDRVFLCCNECIEIIDTNSIIVKIKEDNNE